MSVSNGENGGSGGGARSVEAHYAPAGDLGRRILDALAGAGKDLDDLTTGDLAPVDQFHTGGRDATRELARRASIQPDTHVLDVGGGIGGPARTLASEFGANVTVLDLTESYCRAGDILTERTGLTDKVSFQYGDALAMPFADETFDLVWTQHSSMNVENKARLYGEIRRVLRPGGRLALHEIMAGTVQPIQFPVPWAGDPAISFLRPPQEIRALLAGLGFVEIEWVDATAEAMTWFRATVARMDAGGSPPSVGLVLLLGPAFSAMIRSLLDNLEHGTVVAIRAVFDRP